MAAASDQNAPGARELPAPPDAAFAALLRMAHEMRESGRFEAAAQCYQQFLRLRPDDVQAQIGLMRAWFYLEDWPKAWEALDVRFRFMDSPPTVTMRDAAGNRREKPRWTGGPAPRSLLVLDEQGMGDTIQFIRFLPRLAAEGTAVTLVTHRRLFGLIRTMGAPIELRAMDEPGQASRIESWTPLLSLPGAMGVTTDACRMAEPYLKADPARVEKWRGWLESLPGEAGFTVGVCWRGNPKAPVDAGRSSTLAAFAPLAAVPGVRLVSLQREAGEDQFRAVPFGREIAVPGADFDAGPDAFLDTAALIMSLDLVVTVDTAVAHLAAALGRPVIVALQAREADWRWIPGRSDTVWYPSMRLVRQERQGDWWSALRLIAEEVRTRIDLGKSQELGINAASQPMTPVSVGEVLDKISILEIKRERLPQGPKRDNVLKELGALAAIRSALCDGRPDVQQLCLELKAINEALWEIEDDIRLKEAARDFGDGFIQLARAVYVTNDKRAEAKSRINTLCGSALREEKSYAGMA